MKIVRDELYLKSLQKILTFIADDSFSRSRSFFNSLDKEIQNLNPMPYKFRKSYHYDDARVRDLIFKGYTIPYLVDEENQKIIILDIFKWQNK